MRLKSTLAILMAGLLLVTSCRTYYILLDSFKQ